MKLSEINIRDPYILTYQGKYYLYGTRAASTWGEMNGFDCYVGDSLEEWEGPIEIFKKPDGFWANQNYWAPECYYYDNNFYLITTLGADNRKKGVHVLKADNPLGPFEYQRQLTLKNQECIDGTIYEENSKKYLVYSRTFQDSAFGDMYALEISMDFKKIKENPFRLFSANEASWANPIPFAKSEFGLDGDFYFTDGPCLIRKENELLMLWSSWASKGYSVGIAKSTSKKIKGPWTQVKQPIIEDGGHGMIFRDLDGEYFYTYHYPNESEQERPKLVLLNNLIK
ncbi:glycoside hydrolase family 43 protein [Vagococcus fluvialis]|uniref:glycoside hydrolase family 43 protein n=1 Tax=Vagococcus fluvialis TaxID=2738 RepID=UPI003D13CB1F